MHPYPHIHVKNCPTKTTHMTKWLPLPVGLVRLLAVSDHDVHDVYVRQGGPDSTVYDHIFGLFTFKIMW